MNTATDKQLPPVILRYPAPDGDSYVVIQQSRNDADVYELASSWCDTVEEARTELQQVRRKHGLAVSTKAKEND